MTYKKQNSRGKGGASHQGGWNVAHKLLSKEERDERRLESSQGKGMFFGSCKTKFELLVVKRSI